MQTPAQPTPARHTPARPNPSTSPTSERPNRRRLRWIDAVRAGALAVVVLGHYLMAVVTVDADGATTVTGLLDTAPWAHPLTWLLQVMPAFFAVGAVATARSFAGASPTWEGWRRFMGPRARRLVIPVLPLLALWWLAGPWLTTTFGGALADRAAQVALVPLWFLAVYLVVQSLMPVTVWLVERFDPVRLVGILLAGIALVDVAHRAGVPLIGWVNFVGVWSLPSVLGTAVALGRLPVRRLPRLAAASLLGGVALVAVAGYGVPLVGAEAEGFANTFPPSLLLGLHAVTYPAVVLWLAPKAEGWLAATRRRRVALDVLKRWSMGIYLWHMTGIVAVVALAVALPMPLLDPVLAMQPLTVAWWLARPLLLAPALMVTVCLLALVARPTAALLSASTRRPLPTPLATLVGTIAGSAAVAGVVVAGRAVASPAVVLALAVAVLALHWPPVSGSWQRRAAERRPRRRPDGPAHRATGCPVATRQASGR